MAVWPLYWTPMAASLLTVRNLRVDYERTTALSGFNLTMEAGHLLGLIGPNGAGKTTAMRAIAGLLPIAAGEVRVMGELVEPGNTATLAQIGFAPDTPPTYEDITVETFLRFVGKAYALKTSLIEERIEYWLERLWLTDKRKSKIKALSRGMKQRLTVARTLLPDPALILLDEPAAGLDPAGRVEFRATLSSLRDSGKALIVSSHILADLHEYCTHIAIMASGAVRQMGTVAQVVGGSDDNRCYYDVRLSQASEKAAAVLAGVSGLASIKIDGRMISFEYDHGDEAAGTLLKALIDGGLPVARFVARDNGLEQAYLRTGIRQVD